MEPQCKGKGKWADWDPKGWAKGKMLKGLKGLKGKWKGWTGMPWNGPGQKGKGTSPCEPFTPPTVPSSVGSETPTPSPSKMSEAATPPTAPEAPSHAKQTDHTAPSHEPTAPEAEKQTTPAAPEPDNKTEPTREADKQTQPAAREPENKAEPPPAQPALEAEKQTEKQAKPTASEPKKKTEPLPAPSPETATGLSATAGNPPKTPPGDPFSVLKGKGKGKLKGGEGGSTEERCACCARVLRNLCIDDLSHKPTPPARAFTSLSMVSDGGGPENMSPLGQVGDDGRVKRAMTDPKELDALCPGESKRQREALRRKLDRGGLQPGLLEKFTSAKTNAEKFDLLKMFIMDPSLESIMVETHFVEQAKEKSKGEWIEKSLCDLEKQYSSPEDREWLLNTIVKKQPGVPHPQDPENPRRRLYKVFEHFKHSSERTKVCGTSITASASVPKNKAMRAALADHLTGAQAEFETASNAFVPEGSCPKPKPKTKPTKKQVLTQEQQTKKDFEKDLAQLKTLANKARATAQSLTTAGISNQEAGQQLLVVSMVQKVSYPYAHCKNARGIYRKIAFAKMFTSNYYIYFIVYIYICLEYINMYIYIHTFICTWVTST
ncbi:unnamed protein product [Cladocopium goreaui]|uniref:Uncharacterized protein n=1 Tax=Cladocopium goreaui TaxID=2562237 RepID=A0A9P1D4C6_9DINO|nr:unnamed protein product [Cladocopium goreaui]